MFQSPFDQPSYSKAKKKAKAKRKVKKKAPRKAKKVKKKARKKTRARTPISGYARLACPKRKGRKKTHPAELIRVSKAELEKLRKNVARPTWTDMLPEHRRKVFTYKRRRFYPVYSLLYMISAIEVEKGFKPRKLKQGEALDAHRVQFVQRGSLVDVDV